MVWQIVTGLGLDELGRFPRRYREHSGESPSVTLAWPADTGIKRGAHG